MKELNSDSTLKDAALKAGVDLKTAAKYRDGYIPEDSERMWRTRDNPFKDVWDAISGLLGVNSGLESKTIFEHFQKKLPGVFQDGQLRTLQRQIKEWRALYGPNKEVMFPQDHPPGKLGASDYTSMDEIGITIAGQFFPHKLYHFVLTHSNWETGTVCYSESFASLSEGLQNALWELGAAPAYHLTDRLSAAVNNLSEQKEFTKAYTELLKHYGMIGRKTQPGSPNENGDIEQSNNRFKKALSQSLMLRGSLDFNSIDEYKKYLRSLFKQLNAGRSEALKREYEVMKSIPDHRIDVRKKQKVRVTTSSTLRINGNVYSVPSRLIGEQVNVLIGLEILEVFYSGKLVDTLPRFQGNGRHHINYRHVIESLVRKPGAFENYKYRDALFPSSHFRMAYDELVENQPEKGAKEYLKILKLAAMESEDGVEDGLRQLMNKGQRPTFELVEHILSLNTATSPIQDVQIDPVDLNEYDALMGNAEES